MCALLRSAFGVFMNITRRDSFRFVMFCVFSLSVLMSALLPSRLIAAVATTTITVSICGDAVIGPGEVCDDGLFNDGAYGPTTALRRCNANCSGYGPYCGDGTFQALYLEQCDDGNAVNGDLCSDSCVQEAPPVSTTTPPSPPPPPPSSGGGGGGGGLFTGTVPVRAQTRIILEGKAYPNSSVNVLKDGIIVGVVQANSLGNFSYESSSVTPGHTTFGFWAIDSRGTRSITFTTTFQVTQNAVTTVSNIFLPPTIDLTTKKIKLGESLDVFGSTAPNVKVALYLNKENASRMIATSSSAGLWSATLPINGLQDEAFHTIKSMFEQIGSGAQSKSGFSQAVRFYVGVRDVETPGVGDLSGDNKVNLTDFSILLFHWESDHAIADLNGDGRVNLTDLSILLFNWTG